MKLLRILLIAIGIFGVMDTILVSFISNINLGVLLPGILGLPLLAVGVFLPRLAPWCKTGAGAVLKWVFIGGYARLTVGFLVTSLIIARAETKSAPKNADVLIVLGAGLRGNRPTLILAERLNTTIAYLEENPDTVAIVSGGQGENEIVSEAEVMGKYLAQKGIPAERYLLEDRSKSTEENFRFSNAIIQKRFGENASIVFVTTGFHVYRAGLVANKQNVAVAAGIPSADRWYMRLNNYLRECVAVWVYRLLGRT